MKTRSAPGAPTIRSPTPSPLTSPRPATDSPKRAPATDVGVEIGSTVTRRTAAATTCAVSATRAATRQAPSRRTTRNRWWVMTRAIMRRASGFVLVAKWRVIRLAQGQNATSVTTSAFSKTYPITRPIGDLTPAEQRVHRHMDGGRGPMGRIDSWRCRRVGFIGRRRRLVMQPLAQVCRRGKVNY